LVEALLCLAHTGGTGFLEHPQFPLWATHKNPASVWRSKEIRLLRTLACVGITSFDQCTLGCDAIKPTTILHVRLPELRRLLLAGGHGGRCNHGAKAHERMAGRDENGEFRTARAKIYPAGLNDVIARAISCNSNVCMWHVCWLRHQPHPACGVFPVRGDKFCTHGSRTSRLPWVMYRHHNWMIAWYITKHNDVQHAESEKCHPSH